MAQARTLGGHHAKPAPGVDNTILDQSDFLAVMTETNEIVDWSILSLLLGVENMVVERIRRDNLLQSDSQHQAFVKAWIDTGNASWAILVSGLSDKLVKKNGLANIIAKKYPIGSVKKNKEPSAAGVQLEQQGNLNPKPTSSSHSRQESIDLRKRQIEALLHLPKNKKVQGLIFVVGVSGADGTDLDVANVKETFEKLNFAVYDVLNLTAEEIVCLIQAAAIVNYPNLYRFQYVAFYFAGHGGRDTDGKMFVVGFQKSDVGDEILHIDEYIIDPLKRLQEKKLSRLFFFDCCQSEGSGTAFRSPSNRKQKPHPGELIAFATNEGQKSWGDRKNGGIWTYHLCKNLRESNDDISVILARTTDNVTDVRESFQEPYLISSLGETRLNKDGAANDEQPDPNLDSMSLYQKSPELDDIMAVVGNECDSKELRVKLGVTQEGDMKAAFSEWINREPTPVTWKNLLEALKDTSNIGTVRFIVKTFLKRPSVFNKYNKKENYDDDFGL